MLQSPMLTVFITAFAGYFVIVDPIGVSLIFHALTDGHGRSYAVKMAVKSVLISLALVSLFGLFGSLVLEGLHISMDAFRIAGGILLFHTAFGMIVHPDDQEQPKLHSSEPRDISVYPLSIPMIAGPGALTFTVLEFSDRAADLANLLPLFAAIILVYAITLVSFLASTRLIKFAGRTANSVFKRLLGLMLASLAIQFIIDGVTAVLRSI
jgi:multiple antibiotic resistance protein